MMEFTEYGDTVVYDYLDRVATLAAAQRVATPTRTMIIRGLRSWIAMERTRRHAHEPDAVRQILRDLGDPQSVLQEELAGTERAE